MYLHLYIITDYKPFINIPASIIKIGITPRFFRMRHLKNKHISCLFLYFIILRYVFY